MLSRFIFTLALTAICGTAFSQQAQSPGLELNLEQFPRQSENGQNDELQLDLKQFDQQQESKDLELNVDQFDKNNDAPGALEESLNVNPAPTSGDKPVGKINSTGSAATKIDDASAAELDDNMELFKAGGWLFVVALVIFLLIRARIRKRRRSRPPGTIQHHHTYDESNHR